jgi:hypothetical protein
VPYRRSSVVSNYICFSPSGFSQAFRIVTSVPVKLLRTASKQLQEGIKTARERLSVGSGLGSGYKSSSFSSMDSASSSDKKPVSRHSNHIIPISIREGSREIDTSCGDMDLLMSPITPNGETSARHFSSLFRGIGSPRKTKSDGVNYSTSGRTPRRANFLRKARSERTPDVTDGNNSNTRRPASFRFARSGSSHSFGMSSGDEGVEESPSRFPALLCPPTPREIGGTISGIFHSSLSSLKKAAGSQDGGSSSEDSCSSSENLNN